MGFRPLAREALHVGNPGLAGVDAPVVTLMWGLLTSLGRSYKTRPPGWWVPREVPLTIKLGSIRRMKYGLLLERRSFFFFWIEVERESTLALRETLGRLYMLSTVYYFCSIVVWFPQVLMRPNGDCM
ncbi:hypothetical protein B296_00012124, partial [Ensete ventricosum]